MKVEFSARFRNHRQEYVKKEDACQRIEMHETQLFMELVATYILSLMYASPSLQDVDAMIPVLFKPYNYDSLKNAETRRLTKTQVERVARIWKVPGFNGKQ